MWVIQEIQLHAIANENSHISIPETHNADGTESRKFFSHECTIRLHKNQCVYYYSAREISQIYLVDNKYNEHEIQIFRNPTNPHLRDNQISSHISTLGMLERVAITDWI